jgi:hypothetical protein
MKHLAGEPRQSTCLTTDECRGWPDSRPQKVNVSNAEYSLYTANGASTYKCETCVKKLWAVRFKNTYVRILRYASASAIGNKTPSPASKLASQFKCSELLSA